MRAPRTAPTPSTALPAVPWDGPIVDIAKALGDTTVDAIVAGHTHRVSNLMVGDILVTEGINAGASYSVLQLMVEHGDVTWAGGATRIAKDIGVTPRADVQAIVDQANAETAVLRNEVIGTQTADIMRDLTRLNESQMGDFVADIMRAKYPEVEAAITNSGGLRAGPRRRRRRPAASNPARSPGARRSPCCRSGTARRS